MSRLRVSASARKALNAFNLQRARFIKAKRIELYKQILAKDKIETHEDLVNLLFGLTQRERDQLAARAILQLSSHGLSPSGIVGTLCRKTKAKVEL